jgi:hypothetical protein
VSATDTFGPFPHINSAEKTVVGLTAVTDPRKIPQSSNEGAGSNPSEQYNVPASEDDHLDTFENALKWFSVPANSIACLIRRRWPDGVVYCPTCGAQEVRYLASRELWECKTRHAKSQFSIRLGTIFEDSHIPLGLWLAAIWIVANGALPSSHEVGRRLGITQKSAWSMLRRIKCGWQDTGGERNSQSGSRCVIGKPGCCLGNEAGHNAGTLKGIPNIAARHPQKFV